MPNRDKTGPDREGPMTGRGLGPCGEGLGKEDLKSSGKGLGLRRRVFGFGRRGRGRR